MENFKMPEIVTDPTTGEFQTLEPNQVVCIGKEGTARVVELVTKESDPLDYVVATGDLTYSA